MSSLLPIWKMSPIEVYQKLLPHLSGIDTNNIKLKLVSHDITGDKLLSLTYKSLDLMDIKTISHQSILLRAIAEIYDSETFCAFICSFDQLKPYQHLFKQSKIDLNTFRKYEHSKWKFLNDEIITIIKANLNIPLNHSIVTKPNILTINVQCCRKECTSYIQYANYIEFLQSAINIKHPQGYIIHESMKCELPDPKSFYRYINGEYYRIFCSSCTCDSYKLNICNYEECMNQDSKVVYLFFLTSDVNQMCYAHPKCKRCKKMTLYKTISCDTCNELYCWECLIFINKHKNNKMNCVKYEQCPYSSDCRNAEFGIKQWLSTFGETHICYNCMGKDDVKEIMEAISDTNHDLCDIIVYIIAEYAIGYVTICGVRKCRDEIFIPSTAALVMNKNGNDKTIYHWEPENVSFNDIRRPRILINGKLMRIFCYECSQKRLNKCKVVECGQLEEIGPQCGAHGECIECGSEDLPLYTCVECSHILCEIHSAAGDYYEQKFGEENRGKLFKKGMCRSCSIEREIKSLSIIMKTATSMHMNNIYLNVFICIAQFALGCIVSCCNSYHKCNNEIILDNKFDFNQLCETILNGTAYCYRSNGYYNVKPAVNIWGEWYRIFCSDCNIKKLKYCRRYNCNNYECPDNTKKGYDPICCVHNLCICCGSGYNIICAICNGLYCKKCSVKIGNRSYHELCALKQSFDNLSYDMLEALQFRDIKFNMKISKCVTEYANGYIAQCCNEINECKNDIYINNIWDLKTKKDCNNNYIYYYIPKYFTWNKPMSIVNRKEIRIFCKDCTANQLKKCDKCDRKETLNPNISYCLMHRCCLKCGKNTFKSCSKCSDLYCNDHLSEKQCINCYYTIEYKAKKSAIHIVLNKKRDFYHQFIVNLITQYSMGFSTKCCNNKCEKEICFNNEWEFRLKKDCENNYNEIQYYSPKYPMKNVIIRIINQQNYRIFCNDCNNDTILKKCEYENCENYEIIDRSTSTNVICGVHLE